MSDFTVNSKIPAPKKDCPISLRANQSIAEAFADAELSVEALRLLANNNEVKNFPEVRFTFSGQAVCPATKADAAEAIASVCKAIAAITIQNPQKEPLILNYYHVKEAAGEIRKIQKGRPVNLNKITSLFSLFERLTSNMPGSAAIFLNNRRSEIIHGLKGNFYVEKRTTCADKGILPCQKEHIL